jgi:hypothetical protein
VPKREQPSALQEPFGHGLRDFGQAISFARKEFVKRRIAIEQALLDMNHSSSCG